MTYDGLTAALRNGCFICTANYRGKIEALETGRWPVSNLAEHLDSRYRWLGTASVDSGFGERSVDDALRIHLVHRIALRERNPLPGLLHQRRIKRAHAGALGDFVVDQ